MKQFRVVVDRYYTGSEAEDTHIKEDVKEVEADGFAVDGTGSLFFFINPPEIQVTNPDGQTFTPPRNPSPVFAFAPKRWFTVEKVLTEGV